MAVDSGRRPAMQSKVDFFLGFFKSEGTKCAWDSCTRELVCAISKLFSRSWTRFELGLGNSWMSMKFLVTVLSMTLVAWIFANNSLINSPSRKNAGFVKLPAIVVIPAIVLTVIIFALIGRPDVTNRTHLSSGEAVNNAVSATPASPNNNIGSVASLVGGLEERLKLDPGNGKDWLLLAKSYDHLGRRADALDAYQNATGLGVIDAALEAKIRGTDGQNTDPTSVRIRGSVSLSPDAAASVQPSDTVFVIAHDAAGSPMPLAVLKRMVSDLPFDFELSDKNSMVVGRGISSVENVVVEAKLSATGDALSTNASIIARSEAFNPVDARQVTLILVDVDASVATSN